VSSSSDSATQRPTRTLPAERYFAHGASPANRCTTGPSPTTAPARCLEGQAQRAAVVRALVHRPAVVFADEPTGSLDSVTAEKVLDAMVSFTSASGAALLVVTTHDNIVASHLDRHLVIHDGVTSSPVGAVQ